MVQKRKSRAFTFICSFLPGAAEMYMGLMKNGLTLMLTFFASFMLPTVLGAGDIFMALCFVVWIYGFFHARNIAACDDSEFTQLKDKYIWEEFCESKRIKFDSIKANKWFAIILVIIGVSALWNNLSDIVCRYIPEGIWNDIYPIIDAVPGIVFAVIIIIVGILLIRGRKEVVTEEIAKEELIDNESDK